MKILYFIKKIYWFFQRAFRGWADCDTWESDRYLAKLTSQMLKHLKTYHHGIPCDIYQKYEKLNISSKEKDELAIKEWYLILDKIIKGFDVVEILIDYFAEMDDLVRKECEKIRQEGFDLFKKYYFDLWD